MILFLYLLSLSLRVLQWHLLELLYTNIQLLSQLSCLKAHVQGTYNPST